MKLYFHLLDFHFDVLAAEGKVVTGIPVELEEKHYRICWQQLSSAVCHQLFGTVHPSSSSLWQYCGARRRPLPRPSQPRLPTRQPHHHLPTHPSHPHGLTGKTKNPKYWTS